MNDLSPRQSRLPALIDGGYTLLPPEGSPCGGRLLSLQELAAPLPEAVLPIGLLTLLPSRQEDGSPLPVTDLAARYAEQAFALREAGASCLLLGDLATVRDARAAVLGARQTGLPVLLCAAVDAQGNTADDVPFSAILASVQHLGAAAVGVACTGDRIDTLAILGKNAPLAQVPLFCVLNAQGRTEELPEGYSLTPEQLHDYTSQALRAGGSLFILGQGITLAHAEAAAQAVSGFTPEERVTQPDSDTLFMSCEAAAFYLDESNLMFSDPIPCQYDMAGAILAAEDLGCDVLNFYVETLEDAENFAANSHMIRMPICITSHNEVALELALAEYNGRAFVDLQSEVPDEEIYTLAQGYGAVVL